MERNQSGSETGNPELCDSFTLIKSYFFFFQEVHIESLCLVMPLLFSRCNSSSLLAPSRPSPSIMITSQWKEDGPPFPGTHSDLCFFRQTYQKEFSNKVCRGKEEIKKNPTLKP